MDYSTCDVRRMAMARNTNITSNPLNYHLVNYEGCRKNIQNWYSHVRKKRHTKRNLEMAMGITKSGRRSLSGDKQMFCTKKRRSLPFIGVGYLTSSR